MRTISMEKVEEKLEKRKAKLISLLERKKVLEKKINEVQAEIEKFESYQFEQLKKAVKKEKIEIKVDDIPEILKLIKGLQKTQNSEQSNIAKNQKSPKSEEAAIFGLHTIDDLKGFPE